MILWVRGHAEHGLCQSTPGTVGGVKPNCEQEKATVQLCNRGNLGFIAELLLVGIVLNQ